MNLDCAACKFQTRMTIRLSLVTVLLPVSSTGNDAQARIHVVHTLEL